MKMKKTFKFLTLTVLLSMAGVVSALAQAIKGTTSWADDVKYEITAIRVTSSGDVKEATVSVVDNATPKAGVTEVTIPAKVTLKVSGKTDNSVTLSAKDVEFTVTKVERFGYSNKNDVQKFNIPYTVEEIGADAFHNAASQSNINLQIVFGDATNGSNLKKIGNHAFGNCAARTIDLSNCNQLDLTGSKPFTSAGTGENNQLEKVILPSGIQNIGQAFAGLPKLKDLDLSKTQVTVLEDEALVGTAIEEVTIPEVKDPTVLTTKIGKNAFGKEGSPSKVKKLTINAPIAAPGAIDANAFKYMPALEELYLNGELDAVAAIPSHAFEQSPKLNKVEVNGEVKKAGAIAQDAFADNSNISEVTFNKPVWAGGIGKGAFAGIGQDDCATVNFSTLQGAAAIGEEAFKGAGIAELNFNGNIADNGIAQYAFQNITCGAPVVFYGSIGANGIGERAFENAYLTTLTFKKRLTQKEAVSPYAFTEANITAITFENSFRGEGQNVIGTYAFFKFENDKGTTPVRFENGGIRDDNGIGEHAFDQGAVGELYINGNLLGARSIGAYAFAATPITKITVTGEVANTNTIDAFAFADTKKLAEINLLGNIYTANGGSAIAEGAFYGAGTETANGAVLNLGNLKIPAAIAAGAFASAKFDEVNFSRLMAEKAIADNQFGPMNLTWSREMLPSTAVGTDIRSNGTYATINTVNFNEEFKAWPEAYNNAAQNFVGWNAFTGTKVKTVNFNAPISVEYAIYAAPKAERKAGTFNATYAAQSPFAENGAPMTINFNADVVENGIGAYAFSNSNTVAINLANDADFGMRAFRNWSFYGITWDGTAEKHVDINYDAPTGVTDRSFAQGAFYGATTIVDIYFNTTKEVLNLYTAENNASDLTPYRIKGIATKYIDVIQGADGNYYGVFTPENEMYVIEKYQESGAQVGVWSAYADDLTLEATGEQFIANGRDKYKADLYINPLRVQDKGKYVLNAGHTLIITSSTADKVIAKQDLGKHKDGGVQTFAGLSPWSCNDLRWNPAESNSNNWGGYVNWAAIDNGDKDIYGNVVRDYELFRQYDFATQGLGFGNSINIPEDQMYILVASLGAEQIANRIKYSSYDHNADWFNKNGISWEKSVAELIADAVALAEAAQEEADDKYAGLIKKLQNAAADDQGNPSTLTDEDALIAAVMQKIIDEHLADNEELQGKIIELADELLPLVKAYAKALCDLRHGNIAVERTNRIPLAEADKDPYNFEGTFSYYLNRINSAKEALEADIAELDEYLTVAAGDEQGDDMYKKYLALKALAGNAAEAQALLDEFDALPSEVQDVIANNSRTNADINALGADLKTNVYYPYRNKYVAFTNQTANNSFQFDRVALENATEVDLTAADALFPDMTLDNIDLPSTFKAALDEAAAEAEAQAQLFKDWEDANKAIEDNVDVHAQAAFDNILWVKKDHYALTLWSSDSQYAEEVETIDAVAPVEDIYPNDMEISGVWYTVKPFVVVEDDQNFSTSEVYGVIEGAYGTDQASIVKAKRVVRYASGSGAWEDINGEFVTLVTTSDVKDYLPMAAYKANPNVDNNAFEALLPHTSMQNANDLYEQDINILDVDVAALDEESQRCYDLLKSMKGLIDNGYVVPEEFTGDKYAYAGPWNGSETITNGLTYYALPVLDLDAIAEDVKEAAEEARDKANNWFVAWYTQADEIAGQSSSFDVTYDKEMQKLADLAAIAELDEVLAALMAIEDPYDGESACQKYLDAVAALGTPAVQDDPATADVNESAAATGLYLAVDEAKAAKDDKVDELKEVVNGIEVSTARLNVIWNDGSANVVGIMEAVVKRTATESGNNAIYNLNGMRVKNAGKGIFIQNGKKVIK